MSKEKSPFEILFPFITVLNIGIGLSAINSLRSVNGNSWDTRNIFRDSRQLKIEQNYTTQNEGKITSKQFKELRDLEFSRHR
jgi:hypothetical protein